MTYLSRMRRMRGGTRGLTRAPDCAVPPVALDTGRRTQGACGAGIGSRRRVAPLSRSLGTPPRTSGRAGGASYLHPRTDRVYSSFTISMSRFPLIHLTVNQCFGHFENVISNSLKSTACNLSMTANPVSFALWRVHPFASLKQNQIQIQFCTQVKPSNLSTNGIKILL